jgi:uncharacterized membrane protein
MDKTPLFLPGASKRIEALSDGVFAIVATILVLEIRVPKLENNADTLSLLRSLKDIAPSFIAFVFSFLNILIFWANHDAVGKVVERYDLKITYLNIFFLLGICLIPFTTAFVSEYPFSRLSVTIYGIVLFYCSLIAVLMFRHLAFKSSMMLTRVTKTSRQKIWKRIILGPILFLVAILLGFIHVYIPIVFYILTPLLFMTLPQPDFEQSEG